MPGPGNILAADGYNLALTGMLIVFAALGLLTLFIAALPHVLRKVASVWPEPQPRPTPKATPIGEEMAPLVAAIGFALHQTGGSQ